MPPDLPRRSWLLSRKKALAACSRAYALWTRKEAVLKAGGWGLRDEIADLDVLASPLHFLGRCWHWETLLLKTGSESISDARESAREALSSRKPDETIESVVRLTAASDRPFTLSRPAELYSSLSASA